jgi:opacity protein-like surface antigen
MMQVPAPKYSEMVPQPRFAQESMKWYLRGSFGYGEHENVDGGDQYESNNSVDGTLSAGAGFGYYFRPQIRGDITLDYFAQTKISTLGYDFESTIVMANLYYDIGMLNPNWKYIPYVGAGIGLAYNVLDDKEYDDDIDIAHSFMGGIGFYLEEGWWLDARYRYLNKGALGDGDDTQTDDIISNEIRLGFRYDIY